MKEMVCQAKCWKKYRKIKEGPKMLNFRTSKPGTPGSAGANHRFKIERVCLTLLGY